MSLIKALSVKYQDSIYRMVLRSNDIVLEMKYPDEFSRTLKRFRSFKY